MITVSKLRSPTTEYLLGVNMSLVGHAASGSSLKCNLCTTATFALIDVLIHQTPQRQRETVDKDTDTLYPESEIAPFLPLSEVK